MKFNREELIDDLIERTNGATRKIHELKGLDSEVLNYKESPERWSILECIEHLNLYGDFYLPEIESKIIEQETSSAATYFTSGVIGNYFARLMQVRNGKMTKMKTPADKNPINSALTITTLDRFLKQQVRLEALLEQSRKIDLTRTKVAISLTPWIKLRLGDTFRFLIYHIERHILQAENVLQTTNAVNQKRPVVDTQKIV